MLIARFNLFSLPMKYRDAIEELEAILKALQSQQVEVDELEAKVERATELIALCRNQLRSVEAKTKHIEGSDQLF